MTPIAILAPCDTPWEGESPVYIEADVLVFSLADLLVDGAVGPAEPGGGLNGMVVLELLATVILVCGTALLRRLSDAKALCGKSDRSDDR